VGEDAVQLVVLGTSSCDPGVSPPHILLDVRTGTCASLPADAQAWSADALPRLEGHQVSVD